MTKNQKIFASIEALVEAEGINSGLILEALEEAVAIACRRYYEIEDVEVGFDQVQKRIKIFGYKLVVEKEVLGEEFDETMHIDIKEALEIKKSAKLGDKLKFKLKLVPELMERSTILTAKQVFKQKLREAKYKKIIEDYGDKVGEVVVGTLEEHRDPFMYFRLSGNIDATLGPRGQIMNEIIEPDKNVYLVIEEILPQSKKGPKIVVSRKSEKIVRFLLKKHIPEIRDGLIEVVSVARDAGNRSKVALRLVDENSEIDVIGSAIGTKSSRINAIKRELNGENIDFIEYFDEPSIYLANALAPALVTAVQILDDGETSARIIVPNDQLSLAIGIKGQNVRLTSMLTKWKIDIESESSAMEKGINFEDDII